MGRGQSTGKGGGRGAAYKRGGDSTYQRKSTLDASVLGLGGGAVPSFWIYCWRCPFMQQHIIFLENTPNFKNLAD